MKRFFRKILPVPVWNFLRRAKRAFRIFQRGAKVFLHMPLKKKHSKIVMGFHVTEHCNLNCAGCDNFSPLAEPEFIDVSEFRRDIERMAFLFHNECERISLLGGEPLLHPELPEIIEIARKNFPVGKIRLLTNGTLLSRQEARFWEACRDNDIVIAMTHYPINVDIEKIMSLVKKFGVKIEYSEMTKDEFLKEPVDLSGKGDFRKNFAACTRANYCVMLGHGRLYTCTFASNIHHFSRKFGKNIPVTEADYIDIYKVNDPEQILRRLAEPIPLCRFCDIIHIKPVKWRVSEKDISEWV